LEIKKAAQAAFPFADEFVAGKKFGHQAQCLGGVTRKQNGSTSTVNWRDAWMDFYDICNNSARGGGE